MTSHPRALLPGLSGCSLALPCPSLPPFLFLLALLSLPPPPPSLWVILVPLHLSWLCPGPPGTHWELARRQWPQTAPERMDEKACDDFIAAR